MITNLTQGKPSKVLFYFTLPMILGNVFQQLYNLADTLIVGRFLGKDALAAVGGTFPISFLAIAIAQGASQGCSVIISQYFGSENYKKLKSSISTALISVVTIGLALSLLSILFLPPMMKLISTPAEIYDMSFDYIQIIFMGSSFLFLYNCTTSIFNALGDSKTPLYFLILSTVLNIVLDILFVASFGYGVKGAAYATLISQVVSAIGLFLYFIFKIRKLPSDGKFKIFDFLILKNMFKIAIPTILQQSMISIGMIAVQRLVNSYGVNMTAGYTSATKVDSIAVMPMINIGIAASSYTAQNIGAGKSERVKEGFKAGIKLVLIFSIFISVCIALFGKFFINAFMNDNSSTLAVQYGIEYLNVLCVFYFVSGIMFVSNGILRGSGDMKAFMTSTLVNIALRIAFAYLLTPVMSYHSIFWSIPIGWVCSGLISLIRIKSGKWMKNKLIEN